MAGLYMDCCFVYCDMVIYTAELGVKYTETNLLYSSKAKVSVACIASMETNVMDYVWENL